jgi:hypothetical protein
VTNQFLIEKLINQSCNAGQTKLMTNQSCIERLITSLAMQDKLTVTQLMTNQSCIERLITSPALQD